MNWWTWLLGLIGVKPKPPVPLPKPAPPPIDPNTAKARLIALHNQYRTAHGLSALVANSSLMAAAQAHSDDMATHKTLSHTGSDGSTPFQRMTRSGYAWSTAAENVDFGQTTADAVFNDWVSDPLHLADITGPYRNIGVGRNGTWWTVDLASPR